MSDLPNKSAFDWYSKVWVLNIGCIRLTPQPVKGANFFYSPGAQTSFSAPTHFQIGRECKSVPRNTRRMPIICLAKVYVRGLQRKVIVQKALCLVTHHCVFFTTNSILATRMFLNNSRRDAPNPWNSIDFESSTSNNTVSNSFV